MSDHDQEASGQPQRRLTKRLGLLDVYAISTGAMFSSGFFLLPGLASAETGPSVALAYLIAGVMVLPAMLSAAELSTAMPRAGGPYYFLDRAIGPLMGTVGGIGTWAALVFKAAFALVGMSAYVGLFFDLPVRPLAAGLALAFVALNIVGVKKTSGLQIGLVVLLVGVLGYFLAGGLLEVTRAGVGPTMQEQFTPFFAFGLEGLIATVGLVFVSYAGLTQVASVAEEVNNPGRNIPLGMILSLLTATVIYVLGVAVMVAVLDPVDLRQDLAPVATASEVFLPQPVGLILVVAAAVAAFASTGNAGLLSAARYPLAMARDRLLWHRFAKLGRFDTPTTAVIATGAIAIVAILAFDVESIAKLASAFMLLIFGLMNLAVIVMRESRISAYDPTFRSPFYPWTQLAGIAVSVILVFEIGLLSRVFTTGLVAAACVWYAFYARHRVARDGAIYHVFERLGRRRDEGLDQELFGILAEQGLRDEDRFDEVVARAAVIDLEHATRQPDYEEVAYLASQALVERVGGDAAEIARRFSEGLRLGSTPMTQGVVLPYLLLSDIESPELVIVRAPQGVVIDPDQPAGDPDGHRVASALLFLAGDEQRAGRLLRILAQLSVHVDDNGFPLRWRAASDEQELKEVLLADDRMVSVEVDHDRELAGVSLRDLQLPPGCLIALIRRDGRTLVPRGSTTLRSGDRLTIIGDPEGIAAVSERYPPR